MPVSFIPKAKIGPPKPTFIPKAKPGQPKAKALGTTGKLAQKIDSYLEQRGSPMAGLGHQFVKAGNQYGVDPRMLVGIGVIESGAGAHERIPNNFANWGIHNGVGYKSHDEAIQALAKGLRDGYISRGLRTPRQIVSRYAPSSDGNDEANWANIVSSVVQRIGGSVPRELTNRGGKGYTPPVQPSARTPERITGMRPGEDTRQDFHSFMRQGLLSSLMSGGKMDLLDTISQARSEYDAQPRPQIPRPSTQNAVYAPGAGVQPGGKALSRKGGVLQLPAQWKSTHPTDGLADQGFTHAEDIMGSPGTPVAAPIGGTVMRHGSAQGGQSLWFKGDDGRTFWMGHIESNIPPGTRVEAGDVLATISADHPRPHVHLDYSTTYRG